MASTRSLIGIDHEEFHYQRAGKVGASATRYRLMLSPAAIVEEFGEQWNRCDLRDVMPEPGVVPNGPLVELTSIGVHEKSQRQGYASRALRMLTALCDANEMTIKLVARPLGSNLLPGCPATLSTEQLVAWYLRHGFVETRSAGDDTREMIRKSRMLR
jgi:ribosomal protein S18 acetylase RimI-like enzyme